MRQILFYAIEKLRDNWRIELSGLSLDIAKVLQATEILKTRVPFLFQETKLVTKAIKRFDAKEGSDD